MVKKIDTDLGYEIFVEGRDKKNISLEVRRALEFKKAKALAKTCV